MSPKLVPSFQEYLAESKKKDKHSYACLMVFFDVPFIKELQSLIDEDDVYTEEGDRSFGIEEEHHVTLLYGLHEEVDPKEVMTIAKEIANDGDEVTLKDASLFENEKYDVLKLDAHGEWLHLANKVVRELFPHTSNFPDYHPHCTLAYLKNGKGKKYVEKLKDFDFDIIPTKLVYSMPDGTKRQEKLQIEVSESKHLTISQLDKSHLRQASRIIYNDIQRINIALNGDEDGEVSTLSPQEYKRMTSGKRYKVYDYKTESVTGEPQNISFWLSFSQSKQSFGRAAHVRIIGEGTSEITYFGFWRQGTSENEIYYSLVHELVHALDPKVYNHEIRTSVEDSDLKLKNTLGKDRRVNYLHSAAEFEAWTSAFCEQVLDSYKQALMKYEIDEVTLKTSIRSMVDAFKTGDVSKMDAHFHTFVFNSDTDFNTFQNLFNTYHMNRKENSAWNKMTNRVYSVYSEVISMIDTYFNV